MGRGFSTCYRIILVIVSASALVFSIMAATSCAFVKFDHQYKTEGRYLSSSESTNNRNLQDPADTSTVAVEGGDGAPKGDPVDSVGDGTEDIPVDEGEPPAADGTVEEVAPDIAEVTTEIAAAEAAVEAVTAEAVEAVIADATTNVADTTEVVVPENDALTTDPAEVVVDPVDQMADAPENDASMTDPEAPADVVVDPADQVADAPLAAAETTPDDTDPSTIESTLTEDTTIEEEGNDPDYGDYFDAQDSAQQNAKPTYGYRDEDDNESAAIDTSASASEQPIATASGDAGLFCDGEQSYSVTNLWKGSIHDLEADISDESDANSSEILARNAALVAAVFGLIGTFVLIMESIIGWRLCCEKWILGLVALSACVSQGVTFLFFNSERYCDGDIINEILNQEPCVVGQGGIFSITAIVLYAITMIMACRLPTDDPYGLCCKKSAERRNAAQKDGGGSSKFKFLGGKSGDVDTSDSNENAGDNTARSGQERETPEWISEDKREKDENEML